MTTATIADLQAERDRLRAHEAREAYDEAMAATVGQRELLAAALAVRQVMLDAIDAARLRLLDAIDGEHDETRVHYLMSDAAHDLLAGIGVAAERAAADLPTVGRRVKAGVKPRDLLTVSQWADRKRELRSGTNSPGRWRTALTPYLREIMDDLSEHSPVRQVTFIKSSGVGGPLDLATPIPTVSGWTTMGEIRVGEQVFDEHGKPCSVTYVSPVFEGRTCYEIEFSDGAVVVCDAAHLWTVDDRFPGHLGKRRGEHRSRVTLNTGDIAATFRSRGRWRYSIPVCGALDVAPVELPIPPYVLGYWLANGNRSGNQMTAHEDDAEEIAGYLSRAGIAARARKMSWDKGRGANIILDRTPNEPGKCLRGHVLSEVGSSVNARGTVVCKECHRQHAMKRKYGRPMDPVLCPPGFLTRIRELGIADTKHIPEIYLRASADQRAELLRGLMDGDGSIRKDGLCEYSTSSERLLAGVVELIHSLGFKTSVASRPGRGFSGRHVAGALPQSHRITFQPHDRLSVFKLARKRSRQRPGCKGYPSIVMRRFIADVRLVPSRPVRCIAVDSANHLYLCGRSMIATHNTEALYNWLGYVMSHLANKDMLVVVPTLELRDRSFNPRLAKMLDETPALAELVSTGKRDKTNRGDLLEYGARARVIKAGANSPDSLRSDHLPYVICDEVDAFPWDVGGEGDPMTLIENRQRTYSRAKTYLVSTPTLAGQSRIDMQYQRSDRRRYHVPCPHCGEYQHLEWGGKDRPWGLKWRVAPKAEGDIGDDIDQVVAAWYVCKHCAAEIDEGHKAEMLAAGRWIAERPHVRHHHGYHLNALYAPTGLGLGWRAVAQKWLSAQGDTAELKGFVNTYLGEVWEEQGDDIDDLSLISRLEDYPDKLPIALITAGVDVQKDRLEATIDGWGRGEECWRIDHLILPGDTTRQDVWEELADQLAAAGVEKACIDTGYNPDMGYAFCKAHRWAVPVKGMDGTGRPLIEDERKRKQRLRVKRKRGMPVEPLGVGQGKGLIYARLKMLAPGPGYIHFPRSSAFDDEYFAQLGAERLVTKIRGTRPIAEWVQTRARNEALDCAVYSLAAMRLSGVDLDRGQAAPMAKDSAAAAPDVQRPAQAPAPVARGNAMLDRILSRRR